MAFILFLFLVQSKIQQNAIVEEEIAQGEENYPIYGVAKEEAQKNVQAEESDTESSESSSSSQILPTATETGTSDAVVIGGVVGGTAVVGGGAYFARSFFCNGNKVEQASHSGSGH